MKNRNELSKLYPDVKDKNIKTANTTVQAVTYDVKLKLRHILSVATLIFIPIDILVLFVNSSKDNIDMLILNTGSSPLTLLMSVFLLISLFIVTIAKISNILSETNIDTKLFLIVLYLWLLPTSQLIYNFYLMLNNAVYPIVYALLLYLITIIFVFIVMYLINNKTRTSKSQNILFIFSVVLCIIVTIINSFIK